MLLMRFVVVVVVVVVWLLVIMALKQNKKFAFEYFVLFLAQVRLKFCFCEEILYAFASFFFIV